MLTHIIAILNLVAVLIKICFFTAKCLVLTFINRKSMRMTHQHPFHKFYMLFRVPVCYQAVDNPLFSQLSDRIIQQDGYFNPAFIRPIVGKVLSFISQSATYQCE